MRSDTDVAVRRLRTLGDRLKDARESKGLDVNELGRLAGVSQGYVSKLENDLRDRPSATHLTKIARVLEVRLVWLLQGVEPRHEAPSGPVALPNLERCLSTGDGRWGPHAIAVARTARKDRSVSEWTALLDRIHEALAPFISQNDL